MSSNRVSPDIAQAAQDLLLWQLKKKLVLEESSKAIKRQEEEVDGKDEEGESKDRKDDEVSTSSKKEENSSSLRCVIIADFFRQKRISARDDYNPLLAAHRFLQVLALPRSTTTVKPDECVWIGDFDSSGRIIVKYKVDPTTKAVAPRADGEFGLSKRVWPYMESYTIFRQPLLANQAKSGLAMLCPPAAPGFQCVTPHHIVLLTEEERQDLEAVAQSGQWQPPIAPRSCFDRLERENQGMLEIATLPQPGVSSSSKRPLSSKLAPQNKKICSKSASPVASTAAGPSAMNAIGTDSLHEPQERIETSRYCNEEDDVQKVLCWAMKDPFGADTAANHCLTYLEDSNSQFMNKLVQACQDLHDRKTHLFYQKPTGDRSNASEPEQLRWIAFLTFLFKLYQRLNGTTCSPVIKTKLRDLLLECCGTCLRPSALSSILEASALFSVLKTICKDLDDVQGILQDIFFKIRQSQISAESPEVRRKFLQILEWYAGGFRLSTNARSFYDSY